VPYWDRWSPILLDAVRDDYDDDGKIARAAALFLGRGLPERLVEAAHAVLATGQADLHEAFVAGIADSSPEWLGHPELAAALDLFVEHGTGSARREAMSLRRRVDEE
jgi:hypothetical protein